MGNASKGQKLTKEQKHPNSTNWFSIQRLKTAHGGVLYLALEKMCTSSVKRDVYYLSTEQVLKLSERMYWL